MIARGLIIGAAALTIVGGVVLIHDHHQTQAVAQHVAAEHVADTSAVRSYDAGVGLDTTIAAKAKAIDSQTRQVAADAKITASAVSHLTALPQPAPVPPGQAPDDRDAIIQAQKAVIADQQQQLNDQTVLIATQNSQIATLNLQVGDFKAAYQSEQQARVQADLALKAEEGKRIGYELKGATYGIGADEIIRAVLHLVLR